MTERMNYLDHLARESARFVEVLRTAPAEAAVPSCPEWNAEDLLWHLGEVQWFWGSVVREKILETSQAERLEATRPDHHHEIVAFYERASRDLQEILAASTPDTPAWTWWSPDQTVGFIRRRQAHEALVHRVDAELTVGARTEMDPLLSADGVDEALGRMYGGAPPWGQFVPEMTRTIQLRATDTADTWGVVLGWFTGTDPEDGKTYDEADLRVIDLAPDDETAASVTGRAADLDCWLWHRDPELAVGLSGDETVVKAFEEIIAPGIN